jgi:hypothetical protein
MWIRFKITPHCLRPKNTQAGRSLRCRDTAHMWRIGAEDCTRTGILRKTHGIRVSQSISFYWIKIKKKIQDTSGTRRGYVWACNHSIDSPSQGLPEVDHIRPSLCLEPSHQPPSPGSCRIGRTEEIYLMLLYGVSDCKEPDDCIQKAGIWKGSYFFRSLSQ